MNLSLYSVWIGAENLEVALPRRLFGVIPFTRPVAMGLHAVVKVAAVDPRQAAEVARETLVADFARIPRNRPEDWTIQVRELRRDGAAPPTIRSPGSLGDDWAAAWYPMDDPKAKRNRETVVRRRLWEGGQTV
ncbi:MAG: hypothetical protein COX57_06535 [Alphaproteobacteria bacterium CG_4_10_14_0_2_um_filter_63_37]|nr:MAG: hypothetical protein AUJ55_09170 [Proteobacteria bacterium CG1_02_64_396]PJA24812.1 MAG: hypothetical protein COX57_06535 [Alphaproteobacteria bacterium CG_4_10_14_0_2_um_filter_63_37]